MTVTPRRHPSGGALVRGRGYPLHPCRDDQTVADASYRQRINIPLDCRDGACGTCKAFCESGEYDGGTYIADALSDDEAAAGYVLPCSMKPRSDLVLQIASTSEVAKTQAATLHGNAGGAARLSATTVQFGVEIPNRGELAFLPGQYVNIAVPGTDADAVLLVQQRPARGAAYLPGEVHAGRRDVGLPRRTGRGRRRRQLHRPARLVLPARDRATVLLLAGGTGLAPILSMLRKLRADGSHRTAHLVYGVSTDDDLVELDDDRGARGRADRLHLGPLRGRPGSSTDRAQQGLRHEPDPARAPLRRRRRDLPVRTAADGRGCAHALRRRGLEPTGFYYEKFALAAPQPRHRAPRTTPRSESGRCCRPGGPRRGAPARTRARAARLDARAVAGQVVLPDRDRRAGRRRRSRRATPASSYAGSPDRLIGPVARRMRSARARRRRAARRDGARRRRRVPRRCRGRPRDRRPRRLRRCGARPLAAPPKPAPAGPSATTATRSARSTPRSTSPTRSSRPASALELGALELTLGRLTSQQFAGYRLLAESTVPYVDVGERFVDAAEYTEANAAFHDYLFTLTGNSHLLHAYQALGVKGHGWRRSLRQRHLVRPPVRPGPPRHRRRLRGRRPRHRPHPDRRPRRAVQADDPAGDGGPAHRSAPPLRHPGPLRRPGRRRHRRGPGHRRGAPRAGCSAEGGTAGPRRPLRAVKELADELAEDRSPGVGQAVPVVADLETGDGAESVVARRSRQYGRIDVAVNNVGGTIGFKPFDAIHPPEEIQAEINRSLWPTLWCCRAVAAAHDRARPRDVSSTSPRWRPAASIGMPYAAAKGGINAITAALALEWLTYGIRVAATAPGGTNAPQRKIPAGRPDRRTTGNGPGSRRTSTRRSSRR